MFRDRFAVAWRSALRRWSFLVREDRESVRQVIAISAWLSLDHDDAEFERCFSTELRHLARELGFLQRKNASNWERFTHAANVDWLPSGPDFAAQAHRRIALKVAMRDLPTRYVGVLDNYYRDGMTQEEIAERQGGINSRTVNKMIHVSLDRMRAELLRNGVKLASDLS
jgi:DNA-directed RNA polymerase specialized sigma24 family protein